MRRLWGSALALLGMHCAAGTKPPTMTVNVVPAGSSVPRPAAEAAPAAASREPSSELVASHGRLCLRQDGHVYCASMSEIDATPLTHERFLVKGIDDATSIALGQAFACASTRRGSVKCWGDNAFGELGAKLEADKSDTPVDVVGVAHARRVFAGPWHACAVLDDESLRCWGRNENGQTGSDTAYLEAARELAGSAMVPGVKAESVACGWGITCARSPNGDVTCWGALRDENVRTNSRPTRLPELVDVEAIAAGESSFCGIRRGKVVCWGEGRRLLPAGHGVRGGPSMNRQKEPAEAEGIATAKGLAVADDHACALLADGRVSCFGLPYSEALGRSSQPAAGTANYDPVGPEIVEGLPRAVSITVSSGLSCALTREGDAYCWGRWYTTAGTHDVPKPTAIKLR